MAVTVRKKAARLARSCERLLESCASRTSRTTCARYASSPVRSTSTVMARLPLSDPAMTSSPEAFCTGRLSPVSAASLSSVSPSVMRPSAGTCSMGADDDAVARAEAGDGDIGDGAAGAELVRLAGDERSQLFEGAAGAHHAPHLDPVPDQHQVDERDGLPEEQLARHEPDDDGGAVDERDRDGDGDEGHHARLPLAELLGEAGEEGPAAVDVHDARETRQEPLGAGERHALQPDPLAEHRAQREDGDREAEADPEAPLEVLDHHRVVVVVPAAVPVPAAGAGVRAPVVASGARGLVAHRGVAHRGVLHVGAGVLGGVL